MRKASSADDASVPGVTAYQVFTGALADIGEILVLGDGISAVVGQVDCGAGWYPGRAAVRVPMVRASTNLSGSLLANWTYNPRCGTATNSAGVSHMCVLTTTAVGAALDCAVYFNPYFTATSTTISHAPMVAALVAAHGRGVTVRVVGDDEAASGEYAASYQTLTGAGISVITDTFSYIQHNKSLVIDDQIVWTGSTNHTGTSFTLNANNSIAITDTTMAAVYGTEFEEMWANAFHNAKTDNTPHLFDCNGTSLESYFSPTDLVACEVWDELAHADETVHFAMFLWTDDLFTERAIERIGAGVEVYGVWDQLGAANASSADEALCAARARIGSEGGNCKLHHNSP